MKIFSDSILNINLLSMQVQDINFQDTHRKEILIRQHLIKNLTKELLYKKK